MKRAHELHTKTEFGVSEFCRNRRQMAYYISYGAAAGGAALPMSKTHVSTTCGSTMKTRSAQDPSEHELEGASMQ
jgi:hypothetical protein